MVFIRGEGSKMRVLFVFILVLFACRESLADGWTQKKGSGLLLNTFFIGQQNEFNIYTGGSNLGKTNVMHHQIYGEYGLTDDITIGAKMLSFLNYKTSSEDFIDRAVYTGSGVDSLETFSRIKVYQNGGFVMSGYGFVKVPVFYDPEKRPTIVGPRTVDYGAGFEMGYSFDPVNRYVHIYNAVNHFVSMNYHYRHKDGYYVDETRLDLTGGLAVTPFILILLNYQKISFLYSDGNFNGTDLFDIFGDKGLSKLTASIAIKTTKSTTIEFGYFTTYTEHLTKSNIDIDFTGLMTSIWLNF